MLVALLGAAGCGEQDPADATVPPAGARWDHQIGGATPPGPGVGVVVRDRAAEPAPGVYSICYVNAFQSQLGADVPTGLLLREADGRPVEDPD